MKDINNTTPVSEMGQQITPAEVSLWVAVMVQAQQSGNIEREQQIAVELKKRGVTLKGGNMFSLPVGPTSSPPPSTGVIDLPGNPIERATGTSTSN